MTQRELAIILPTKNAGDRFELVLGALLAQCGVEEADILVIDSGSTDRTLEIARSHRQVRVHEIAPAEFGHGRTRNLGVSLVNRPVVVFLVQDATPVGEQFLDELAAPLLDPAVAGAYCRQMAYESASPVEKMFLAAQYPAVGRTRSWSAGEAPMRIDDIFFSNVGSAIRRSVLQAIPFDETIVMSEDQAWSRAALRAGWKLVYQPSAVVRHSHDYGLWDVFRRNFDSGASLVGITDDSLAGAARYELAFLRAGSMTLWKRRRAHWIPYLLLHEAARAAGFTLGRHSTRLPRRARRTFSRLDRGR